MIFFDSSLLTDHNTDRCRGVYCTDTILGLQGIIYEALVYSERGEIEFLPALPEEWKQGSVDGLMARTRICIRKLAWNLEKKILEAELESYEDQEVRICLPGVAIRCMLLSKTGRTAQGSGFESIESWSCLRYLLAVMP